jgi:hypothetical protein
VQSSQLLRFPLYKWSGFIISPSHHLAIEDGYIASALRSAYTAYSSLFPESASNEPDTDTGGYLLRRPSDTPQQSIVQVSPNVAQSIDLSLPDACALCHKISAYLSSSSTPTLLS